MNELYVVTSYYWDNFWNDESPEPVIEIDNIPHIFSSFEKAENYIYHMAKKDRYDKISIDKAYFPIVFKQYSLSASKDDKNNIEYMIYKCTIDKEE